MRNINWRQSFLLPFRLVQEFEFINDVSADTFTLLCFPRTIRKLWNLRQKSEKKSIKIFLWLIRKHAFCWQSPLLLFVCSSAQELIWKCDRVNGLRSATAWENVVWSPCCDDVVVYVVSQTTFIVFIQTFFVRTKVEWKVINLFLNFFFSILGNWKTIKVHKSNLVS